jgi:3-(3-hydroxy-phenyl)propionate hydroxylase
MLNLPYKNELINSLDEFISCGREKDLDGVFLKHESDFNGDFDVAIVGYGPVGATLANLLGLYGLRVGVFEREDSVYHQPRASHMDGEVMRIYQSAGLSESLESITIGAKGYEFLNAEGKVLLKLQKPEGKSPQGWDYHYRFYQPTFEAVLREGVKRFGNVSVYLNADVIDIVQEEKQVTLGVVKRQEDVIQKFSAKYIVGCDGGRSMVRRTMDTSLEDVGLRQQWLVIDVKLKHSVDLPKLGIQYCNPARPITYVPKIGGHDRFRWEMMLMPNEQKDDMERPERVWELLSPWLNSDDAVLERAAVYNFHSVLAAHWRKGRVLLAGDSAHQMPPFLGQGMCAGVRDASNLAWKLQMVIKGKSNDGLLDTYQSERSHHVRSFIDMATELGKIITEIDPVKAKERDKKFLEGPTQTLVQPAPILGPGLHGDEAAPVRDIFPQPKLQDGRLLDEALGLHFAVIGDASVVNSLSDETKRFLDEIDAVVLTDFGSEVQAVLDNYGKRIVMLRPDRYMLGTASDAAEFNQLVHQLQRQLKI